MEQIVKKGLVLSQIKIIRKNKYFNEGNHFLNNADTPAISKNIALMTLM